MGSKTSSVGDLTCRFAPEFHEQEISHLYQLCHFGRQLLTTKEDKLPSLSELGVDLSDFSLTADHTIKVEAADAAEMGDIATQEELEGFPLEEYESKTFLVDSLVKQDHEQSSIG